MNYHILNGDSLAAQLKHSEINGKIIVCREALIDGPLSGGTLSAFFTKRSNYISDTYNPPAENYFRKVASEFESILRIPDNSEICLWFENDLFCQANMWFVLSLLFNNPSKSKVFRIFPIVNQPSDLWKGFGNSDAKMFGQSYKDKVPFTLLDIELGNDLWNAYKINDLSRLSELSKNEPSCFQYLEPVCQAHIDRFPAQGKIGRPEKTVKEIYESGTKDFNELFAEFSSREGIYGFGDLQVKLIYDRLIQNEG